MSRFLLAGPEARGRAFSLSSPAPAAGWIVGSAAAADVRIAEDPRLRSVHARVLERDGRFLLRDEGGGTFLNWQPLGKDEEAPLAPGDLVGVGSTLLLFAD